MGAVPLACFLKVAAFFVTCCDRRSSSTTHFRGPTLAHLLPSPFCRLASPFDRLERRAVAARLCDTLAARMWPNRGSTLAHPLPPFFCRPNSPWTAFDAGRLQHDSATLLTARVSIMASRIESLPPELLLRLAGFILRPSDLKALCLTSKAMRVPATTALYHTITLAGNVPGWRDGILETKAGFFSSKNPGLQQIRKLRLQSAFDDPSGEEDEAVETVLNALPSNVLRQL